MLKVECQMTYQARKQLKVFNTQQKQYFSSRIPLDSPFPCCSVNSFLDDEHTKNPPVLMGTSKPLTLDQNMFTAGLLSEPLPSKSPSKPSLSQLAEKLATFNSSMAGNHFRLPAIVPQHSSKAVLTDKVLLQEDLVTTKAHPGFNNHQKYRMTIYKTNSI